VIDPKDGRTYSSDVNEEEENELMPMFDRLVKHTRVDMLGENVVSTATEPETGQWNILTHAFYLMNRVTKEQVKGDAGMQLTALMNKVAHTRTFN